MGQGSVTKVPLKLYLNKTQIFIILNYLKGGVLIRTSVHSENVRFPGKQPPPPPCLWNGTRELIMATTHGPGSSALNLGAVLVNFNKQAGVVQWSVILASNFRWASLFVRHGLSNFI